MVLTVTEPARDKILELRAQEEASDTLGLRIEVTGVQGVEYTYDLTFDPVADADVAAGDLVETQGELPVIIPVDSLDALKGATLDPPSSPSNGLVLRNPNRPDPLSGAHIELSGTTDEKGGSSSMARSTRRSPCTAVSPHSTGSRATSSTSRWVVAARAAPCRR